MDIKTKIIKSSLSDKKKEICGFVVKTAKGFDLLEASNGSPTPEKDFCISAKEFLFTKNNYDIIAVYHSHPKGTERPSVTDKGNSESICYPFVIYSIQENKFSVYRPEFCDSDQRDVDILERLLCED